MKPIHPAKKYDFNFLITEIEERVKAGYVQKIQNGDLTLYHYTNKCKYEKAWDNFTLSCRGLVVDSKKIVALPFPKFFNYGEMSKYIPKCNYKVYEKYDGSLIVMYYYNGEWRAHTKNAFDNEQSRYFRERIKKVDLHTFNKDRTYLFEVIYPENRIVIKYDFAGFVFLSSYDLNDGTEYIMRGPKTYNIDFEQAKENLKILKNKEGYVVRFENGYRVKLKCDEYCRLHAIITNPTPLGVWRVLRDNVEVDLSAISEEYLNDYKKIKDILEEKFSIVILDILNTFNKTAGLTNKELGLELKEFPEKFSEAGRRFIFEYRNHGVKLYKLDKFRNRIFEMFRPNDDILEGYEPSNSLNRFQEMKK